MDAGMRLRPNGHHQERGAQKTLWALQGDWSGQRDRKKVGINVNLDQVHVNTNQSLFLLADTIYRYKQQNLFDLKTSQ